MNNPKTPQVLKAVGGLLIVFLSGVISAHSPWIAAALVVAAILTAAS